MPFFHHISHILSSFLIFYDIDIEQLQLKLKCSFVFLYVAQKFQSYKSLIDAFICFKSIII